MDKQAAPLTTRVLCCRVLLLPGMRHLQTWMSAPCVCQPRGAETTSWDYSRPREKGDPDPWPVLKHIPHGSSEPVWEMKPPLPPTMSSSITGRAGSLSFSVSLSSLPFLLSGISAQNKASVWAALALGSAFLEPWAKSDSSGRRMMLAMCALRHCSRDLPAG